MDLWYSDQINGLYWNDHKRVHIASSWKHHKCEGLNLLTFGENGICDINGH
jgi:hypothetical protein